MHRCHLVRRSNKKDRQRWDIETVQGTSRTECEDIQHYGMTSNPTPGDNVEALVCEAGHDASRLFVIAKFGDSEKVVQVEEGAMAIYSPDEPENIVTIKKDGTIEVAGKKEVCIVTEKAVVNSPDVILGGESGGAQVLTTSGPSSKVRAIV